VVSLEGPVEGRFRFVANLVGDARDGIGCFSEQNGSLHQPLPGKIAHGRVAEQSIEPVRESRPRKADFAGQILSRPGMPKLTVEQAESA
jgi:hypothetical protein